MTCQGEAHSRLIDPHPSLSIGVSCPGLLSEAIVEVICDVSPRLLPGLFIETVKIHFHRGLAIDSQNVVKFLYGELPLLFFVRGHKTKIDHIALFQLKAKVDFIQNFKSHPKFTNLHVLIRGLCCLYLIFVDCDFDTVIIRVVIRS